MRTPVSMKTPEEIAAFQALDLDAAVVVAFGQILVKDVLEAPRLGCFNLHASLLPRWRGAAPIQRSIMAGDAVTGVQVMRMSEGLDEGPVLMGEQVRIDALETAGTLHDKLAAVGSRLLPIALAAIERGGAREVAAGRGGRHLRQEDQVGRGPHRLDPPGRRGRPPYPGPFPVPGRVVRGGRRKGPGARERRCCRGSRTARARPAPPWTTPC